jgi:hypothetical protein
VMKKWDLIGQFCSCCFGLEKSLSFTTNEMIGLGNLCFFRFEFRFSKKKTVSVHKALQLNLRSLHLQP